MELHIVVGLVETWDSVTDSQPPSELVSPDPAEKPVDFIYPVKATAGAYKATETWAKEEVAAKAEVDPPADDPV